MEVRFKSLEGNFEIEDEIFASFNESEETAQAQSDRLLMFINVPD